MTAYYRFRSLLKWIFRRDDVEQALADDLEDYIERSAAEKMRQGLSREEAIRAARIELGGVERTKEEVRATLAFAPLDALLRDVRYAFRSFRAQKTFTAVIVLCLALGIGANATVFSFLDSILLRSLPVRNPDSVVRMLWTIQQPGPDVPFPSLQTNFLFNEGNGRVRGNAWSYPAFELFAEETDVLADIFGRLAVDQITVDDGEGPLASGTFVTGSYFAGLGVRPVAGRLLGDDDDRFDAPPAIVLDEEFSEARYGSAGAALGETIRLNGVAFTVVGVTPGEFFGLDPARSPDFYIPMRSGPLFQTTDVPPGQVAIGTTQEMFQRTDFYWMVVVARLRPGVSIEQANTVLGTKFDGYYAANAQGENALRNPPVLNLSSGRTGFDSLRFEYSDPLAVLFSMVLLILAVTCAGIAVVTGVLFGLAPALHATRVSVFPALKGSRSIESDPHIPGRLRVGFGQLLVVSQIALSLVLLIGASLFGATLSNLRTTELGYNTEGLLFATVNAGRAGYAKEELVTFYQRLRMRLIEETDVEAVSYSWSPLAGGGAFGGNVSVPGTTEEPEPINIQIVGEQFFETLGIPILHGRAISEGDINDARAVAVIDQTFAETYFPGIDATGRTIEVPNEGELTIIGVAADARQDLIRDDVLPVVYYTYTFDPHPLQLTFYELRTRIDPLAFRDRFRSIVRDLDPAVIVTATATHRDQIDSSISMEIMFARLSEAFAGLALLIACVALYGTVSYAMARRTPEIGIRIALGASRGRVLKHAFRQILWLGVAGLVLGVPAAIVAARFVESFLWGVAPYEPGILFGAAVAVLAAVAVAGFVPARRASLIDPMVALRSE